MKMFRVESARSSAAVVLTLLTTTILAAQINPAQAAKKFKPKYYAECYQPIGEARDSVPSAPIDVAGKAQTAGQVADMVGKLGGFGGFGGLGKAASTAATVSKYSNLVADAAQFTQKMQEDYPDGATRLAAYGDKMSEDADTMGAAALKINEGQACYETALNELQAGLDSGEIKSKDAKARQKEIREGLEVAEESLADARANMDVNSKSFNEALTNDSPGLGLNMATLGQAVSIGSTAANMAGVSGGRAGYSPDAVTRARIEGNMMARGYGNYSAYRAQSDSYTNTWWSTYNSTRDPKAAAAAAQAAATGGQSSIRPYQMAYWNSQAKSAAVGNTGTLANIASSPLANLQTLSVLSKLSGGGGALIGAQIAAGMVMDSAKSGEPESAPALSPETQAINSGMATAGQTVGTLNAMRGLSGTGGAVVGANMAAGLLSQAMSGSKDQAAAPAEMTEDLEASLMKTSIDTSRMTDAYGLVDLQAQKNAQLMEMANAKIK